jgi:hypothetical protein
VLCLCLSRTLFALRAGVGAFDFGVYSNIGEIIDVRFFFDLGGTRFADSCVCAIADELRSKLPSARNLVFLSGSTQIIGTCAQQDVFTCWPNLCAHEFVSSKTVPALRIERFYIAPQKAPTALFLTYARQLALPMTPQLTIPAPHPLLLEAARPAHSESTTESTSRIDAIAALEHELFAPIVNDDDGEESCEKDSHVQHIAAFVLNEIRYSDGLPVPLKIEFNSFLSTPIFWWRVDGGKTLLRLYLGRKDVAVTQATEKAETKVYKSPYSFPPLDQTSSIREHRFNQRTQADHIVELLYLVFETINSNKQ